MIKSYFNPSKEQWSELSKRVTLPTELLDERVKTIIAKVKEGGDEALLKFAEQFDSVKLSELKVSEREIKESISLVSEELKEAISFAYNNIRAFHLSQKEREEMVESTKGVICWRRGVAIEKVGLYIPGGSAPLFSTLLMLATPAIIAGCKEIVLSTPPNREGKIAPIILYTVNLLGLKSIYKVGGAQAIAAMAYGTESIPKVFKIFGPGNQYVTAAKRAVQQLGVAIDMPAGPSELLVIADSTSDVDFIAADLLAQAEHGVDSQVVLLSNCKEMIANVNRALKKQLPLLPRKEVITEALHNSFAIYFDSLEECLEFSNHYAPEHLILAFDSYKGYIDKIVNAGSVFLGRWACESAGDYASGTNHTLPTNGFAKSYSGLSLDSFMKKITFQAITEEGINNLGRAVELMAEAEQLIAHKRAVSIRLKKSNNEI